MIVSPMHYYIFPKYKVRVVHDLILAYECDRLHIADMYYITTHDVFLHPYVFARIDTCHMVYIPTTKRSVCLVDDELIDFMNYIRGPGHIDPAIVDDLY